MKRVLIWVLAVSLGAVAGCGSSEDRRKYQDAEKPQSGEREPKEKKSEK